MWQAISRNKGTDKLKVVEIFDSIDGEGKRTGQPCTFIRLAGCNLRCSYCDTLYALFGEKEECVYEEMSVPGHNEACKSALQKESRSQAESRLYTAAAMRL